MRRIELIKIFANINWNESVVWAHLALLSPATKVLEESGESVSQNITYWWLSVHSYLLGATVP